MGDGCLENWVWTIIICVKHLVWKIISWVEYLFQAIIDNVDNCARYTVPNCQDDHLSQQGFFLTLRAVQMSTSEHKRINIRTGLDKNPALEGW
jgi:hypothetical protein